ncbi:MAG: hypothetical protein ACI9KE_006502 [Polyangiales bacterium]|jgi:hypothetical protein
MLAHFFLLVWGIICTMVFIFVYAREPWWMAAMLSVFVGIPTALLPLFAFMEMRWTVGIGENGVVIQSLAVAGMIVLRNRDILVRESDCPVSVTKLGSRTAARLRTTSGTIIVSIRDHEVAHRLCEEVQSKSQAVDPEYS